MEKGLKLSCFHGPGPCRSPSCQIAKYGTVGAALPELSGSGQPFPHHCESGPGATCSFEKVANKMAGNLVGLFEAALKSSPKWQA